MEIVKKINPAFGDYIEDWEHSEYIIMGGYGSSKSYHTALKIILKLLKEKRKCLVVRQTYNSIRESCFDLFKEILNDMDLLTEDVSKRKVRVNKVTYTDTPMGFKFPNGSRIIFKGLDKVGKIKSINGVSIVWVEEASEITYSAYKELMGRARMPNMSLHFISTFNPVGMENWTVKHFFEYRNEEGKRIVILDHKKLYKYGCISDKRKNRYYLHTTADDNYFLSIDYIERLDDMKDYDPDLYRIARKGQLGPNGLRVLPQFTVAKTHKEVMEKVRSLPRENKKVGMDFGFETSYNALVKCAIEDLPNGGKNLYIYWEYYKNHKTDPETVKDLEDLGWDKERMIVADCAEPKTIRFYQQSGFKMRACRKKGGSRLENTKKIKRFHKIICSPKCYNSILELENLIYAKDNRDEIIPDEFNIDSHVFSALWYALDMVTVADVKYIPRNTKLGVKQ